MNETQALQKSREKSQHPKEPIVELKVGGEFHSFLVDSGATYTTLRLSETDLVPQGTPIQTVGFGGVVIPHQFSEDVEIVLDSKRATSKVLLSPTTPVNLLGRDLLMKFGATLQFSPNGKIRLTLPEQGKHPATTLMLLQALHVPEKNQKPPPALPGLDTVPEHLWTNHQHEVGAVRSGPPIVITLKPNVRFPRVPQYRLSKEQIEGIAPVIESFLEQEVLKILPHGSVCNTPILPVKKEGRVDALGRPVYRFVQDLRAINKIVLPRANIVPNPATILSSIPDGSQYFSVIDIASAFFSVGIAEESQFLFAFTYEGRTITWRRLPQGYVESPSLFTQALLNDLADLVLPGNSALVVYVDDLLLAAPTKEDCEADSLALLHFLAAKRYKVNKEKLQLAQTSVNYLGHVLSHDGRKITPKRVEEICKWPIPKSKRDIRMFLGAVGYCRSWVNSFSAIAKPLTEATKASTPDPVVWTPELNQAWRQLKQAIMQPPALGYPNYNKPFYLYCDEREGAAVGVLVQKVGPLPRPLAYYSGKLDGTSAGFPKCLRAVSAAALLVEKCQDLVLGNELNVMVGHAVAALLLQRSTQHLTNERLTKYERILLLDPSVHLQKCTGLNPATLLPISEADIEGTGESHDCLAEITAACTTRVDLQDYPLDNPDYNLFTDGSAKRNSNGQPCVGYAIVLDGDTVIDAKGLPPHYSAQAAELYAAARACEWAEGKRLNLFLDSKYCFSVFHGNAAIWRHRGFLTSAGTPVANGPLIAKLLYAMELPAALAVIHVPAHTGKHTYESLGNAEADKWAKWAAENCYVAPDFKVENFTTTEPITTELAYWNQPSPNDNECPPTYQMGEEETNDSTPAGIYQMGVGNTATSTTIATEHMEKEKEAFHTPPDMTQIAEDLGVFPRQTHTVSLCTTDSTDAYPCPITTMPVQVEASIPELFARLASLQQAASQHEIENWVKAGAELKQWPPLIDEIYVLPDGRPVAPRSMVRALAHAAHAVSHMGNGGVVNQVNKSWYAPGISVETKKIIQNCIPCQKFAQKPKRELRAYDWVYGPFQHLQIDFIELPPCKGFRFCLTVVDLFSGWPECFPVRYQSAEEAARCIVRDVAPRFGIPVTISSDRGGAFVSNTFRKVLELLAVTTRLHCPYHPQGNGSVERRNGDIKQRLHKLCEDSGLNWLEALPIVMLHLRNTPNRKHNLTPFEILFGRPFPVFYAPPQTMNLAEEHDHIVKYVVSFGKLLKVLHTEVQNAQAVPSDSPCHDIQPGDLVWVLTYRRRNNFTPKWEGPYEALLVTTTAIKVRERESWVHASHARKAHLPKPDDPTATPTASPEECAKQQPAPPSAVSEPFQREPYLLRSKKPADTGETVPQSLLWSPDLINLD